MRLHPVVSLSLFAVCLASPAAAQTRVVDEGTFVTLKGGVPVRTESFKITRGDGGLITATGNVSIGQQQITSALTTDSLGTPGLYELHVRDKSAKVVDLRAVARAGRLTSLAKSPAGDESMREYPLTAGKSLVVEPGLLHHLYFVALGKGPGAYQVIEPRAARAAAGTLTARGLEPIEVGGRSVTATHYSLVVGAVRHEFWVDSQGRLLRVDSVAEGLSATREELPK